MSSCNVLCRLTFESFLVLQLAINKPLAHLCIYIGRNGISKSQSMIFLEGKNIHHVDTDALRMQVYRSMAGQEPLAYHFYYKHFILSCFH